MAVRLSAGPHGYAPTALRVAAPLGRALLLAAALAAMAPLAEARTPTTQGIMGYGLLNADLPNSRLWNGDPAVENFGSEFPAVDPATKDIGWVVVKANPVDPRDALLGALSANAGGTLYIYTWTYAAGGTGNWTLTWQTPVSTYVHRCFDIAYERESGDAVVVYASSTTPTQLLYRSRVSGSWTGALTAGSPLAYSIRWVRARTKPTAGSNDIFVASVTKGSGVIALSLHALRWDGASSTSPGGSWGDQIRTAADPAQADYEPYDLGFETQTGRVHLIWGDSANPANILYRIFTPGTGWSSTEASAYDLGGAKTTNWVTAGSDPSSDRIAIGVVEATNELIFGGWTGSAWVTRPADEEVNDPHQRTITVRFDAMGGVARYVFSLKALSTTFNYRTWDGTSFSAISSLGGTTSQPIRFLALRSHPTRNIMMALYSEQGGGLYHRYWNGEAATPYWSPATTLSTDWAGTTKLNETNQYEPFMFDWLAGYGPTAALVTSLKATTEGKRVVVEWQTASELGTAGFYLERFDEAKGKFEPVHKKLLPALVGAPQGGTYRLVDPDAKAGQTCTYRLIEIEAKGTQRTHGPFRVTVAAGEPSQGLAALLKTVENAGLNTEGYSQKANKKEGAAAPPGLFARALAKLNQQRAKQAKAEAKILAATQALAAVPGSKPAVKITVKEDGLYFLSAAEFAPILKIGDKAIENVLRKGNLLLACQGKPVRYLPAADSSGIYFYGQGIHSIYTDENVYWLWQERGLVMNKVAACGAVADPAPGAFAHTVHAEVNQWPLTGICTDPEGDFWVWDYAVAGSGSKGSSTLTVDVPDPAPAGAASLTVRLKGGTQTDANPDHHAVVSLNGTVIGEGRWDGLQECTLTLLFDPQLLLAGPNTVSVQAVRDAGVAYSIFYVNWLDLTYPRSYRAVGESLRCAAGRDVLTVDGFTDPAIAVFDVTDPLQPAVLEGPSVEPTAAGFCVSVPATAGSAYLALAPGAVKTPVAVEPDVPSRLAWPGNKADYVVIAPAALMDGARALAAYREGKKFATMVVDLEDIYDEFNFGIADPHAIQAFLALARGTWKTGPRYAVLAGNGTFDYKNYLGYGDNLVPPLLTSSQYGLFASDPLFAPDGGFAIGRLPAVSPGEMSTLVSKIAAYEGGKGKWTQQVILAADAADKDAGDFPADSDDLSGLVPPPYAVEKVFLSQMPLAAARTRLLGAINSGAFLLNYIGHGGMDRFTSGGLLTVSDAGSLSNGDRLPVVTAFTCIAGRFEMPGYQCLGKALVLKSGGGGIAFWGPSGMSENDRAKAMGEAFFRNAFAPGQAILGDVVVRAAAVAPGQALLYQLLGDPALRLQRP